MSCLPHSTPCLGLHRTAESRPILVFVQENEREFLQGVDHGLRSAAKDRGLAYRRIVVDNDVSKAVLGSKISCPSRLGP